MEGGRDEGRVGGMKEGRGGSEVGWEGGRGMTGG